MDFKGFVKNKLEKCMNRTYDEERLAKTNSFDAWIRVKEEGLERFDMTISRSSEGPLLSYAARYGAFTVRIIPFSKVHNNFAIKPYVEDILVFTEGELTDRAIPLIAKTFANNADVNVVYGDEDIAELQKNEPDEYGRSVFGTRKEPYFKPDWSPNTFLSHFYFCNIVAVRRSAFRDEVFAENKSGASAVYNGLLRYIFTNELNLRQCVKHIDEILIHSKNYDNNYLKDEESGYLSNKLKVRSYGPEGYRAINKTMITVVIPSKDNPGMLERCISSLKEYCPAGIVLQIIVVDNGSNDENRKVIEEFVLNYGIKYEYRQMDFNFARMCNIGAALGTGEYILLLNDDVYFTQGYVLENLLEQASYRFTGAVGAKLLYPENSKIQHAGIVNNRIGPVHKLQFKDDLDEYYFGFNRFTVNVLAVTGACLLVRRDLYEKFEGLSEGFRVAFNDVDFCYRLFEAGYYNVCCNNISLCHAESVSRGHDTDMTSMKRLQYEKNLLFAEHPVFLAHDPFFNRYLLSDCLDTRIAVANEFEYSTAQFDAGKARGITLNGAREEECVILNVEYAGNMQGYTFNEENAGYIFIEGFSFVMGSDNSLFDKFLLLKNDETCLKISFESAVRHDVEINCPDQRNVALSGFAVRINKNLIPGGVYRVGILQKKKFSRERLYKFSNREVVTE